MTPFAVIFDMDGVLVDSNPYHKIALQKFCEKYGFTLTEDDFKARIYGRTNKDWLTNLFGTLSEEQLKAYATEKELLYQEIYRPFIKEVHGLKEFLHHLQIHEIPYAIGTSAPAINVAFTLSSIGLSSYFHTILDERFVAQGKPHPEIYLKVADRLGFPPNRCLVIEDSFSGIEAGIAAGAKVIGITTTHTREELAATNVSLVIEDFDELSVDVLEEIVAEKKAPH
ncbi:MAG: HAD family phosphatase [Flammeovirgaceae bacterium]|nr:HAD family phosphatase [Flammeovirgaceae bacterium]MDW8288214.1 HAD family phosphatase [Flammeovirgaceae bacterium]